MNSKQNSITPEQAQELARPFTAEQCELKNGFTFIGARFVIERLNQVFGVGGWSWVVDDVCLTDALVTVRGTLTAGGVSHSGCGMESTKGDEENKIKKADTYAMKRAARLFTIGLHLYDPKDAVTMELKRGGSRRGNGYNRPPQQSQQWRGNGSSNGGSRQPRPASDKQLALLRRMKTHDDISDETFASALSKVNPSLRLEMRGDFPVVDGLTVREAMVLIDSLKQTVAQRL